MIDKIYPEAAPENAVARSSTWRIAIISFLPDVVAMPLLDKIKAQIEDRNPMSDQDINEMALEADECIKRPLSGPFKYERMVGASPVVNQIHFNSMNTSYSPPHGMPLEGYVNPYQAYQAYLQMRDSQVIPAALQVNQAVIAAQVQTDLQAVY